MIFLKLYIQIPYSMFHMLPLLPFILQNGVAGFTSNTSLIDPRIPGISVAEEEFRPYCFVNICFSLYFRILFWCFLNFCLTFQFIGGTSELYNLNKEKKNLASRSWFSREQLRIKTFYNVLNVSSYRAKAGLF